MPDRVVSLVARQVSLREQAENLRAPGSTSVND